MSFKNIARAVAEQSINYLKTNGKNIAVTVLAETLDVPITTVSRNMYRPSYTPTAAAQDYPRNASEAAIDSLYVTAQGLYSESRKSEIAQKIFDIARNGDDNIRIYAIRKLQAIQSKMYSESRKSDISMLIASLA